MAISQALEDALDAAVTDLLAQDGREAISSVMISTTYLLNWAAYKLGEEGAPELGAKLLDHASAIERELLEKLGSEAGPPAARLRFPDGGPDSP